MIRPSVVGMFCESIREEVGEKTTIVGILPTNLEVEEFPATILNLGLYVRINVDSAWVPTPIKISLGEADGKSNALVEISEEFLKGALEDARVKDQILVTLVFQRPATPFHVKEPTNVQVTVNIDGEEFIATGIRFAKKQTDPA